MTAPDGPEQRQPADDVRDATTTSASALRPIQVWVKQPSTEAVRLQELIQKRRAQPWAWSGLEPDRGYECGYEAALCWVLAHLDALIDGQADA